MIPIAKPYVGEQEARAAQEVIQSGWVTQGPKVQEFEKAFADYVKAPHACAVSSCTTALHLALLAVGVKPGDVVLTVSHSFISTANCIRYCGAEPVFVDISLQDYNISVEDLRECLARSFEKREEGFYHKEAGSLITEASPLRYVKSAMVGRLAAILVVHQMGMPCDIGLVADLAKQYGVPIVEDAACAIGSQISFDQGKAWEKIGRPHGDVACFSFHPRKVITTGEGGMITTASKELDASIRLLRHVGMNLSDVERHHASKICFEQYPVAGFNYRMTDIQAAIGLEQLKRLPDFLDRRRAMAERYARQLREVPWLATCVEAEFVRTNWQSFPVRIVENAPCGQVALMQHLQDLGISTRRGIMNAHQEQPYMKSHADLPLSETARDSVVLLPFYYGLMDEEIDTVVREIKNV